MIKIAYLYAKNQYSLTFFCPLKEDNPYLQLQIN